MLFFNWRKMCENVYDGLCKVHRLAGTISRIRHFSHVTNCRGFKNLNLRRKVDRFFEAIGRKIISST